MPQKVAEALADGSIVARFEGGCEYGPRALGHRSILADPVFLRMKDVVNARVKFREAFRPFAPFVPLDRANEVFELEAESPFHALGCQDPRRVSRSTSCHHPRGWNWARSNLYIRR